ncbi:MAG: hypothetical protein HY548_08175 [Elusimicrobia bacterium]|nr:hypothetical protein [Elusimicrobiota bacterium]
MNRKAVQILAGVLVLLVWGIWGAYGIPTARLEGLANVPNPFDSRQTQTYIVYSLAQDAHVDIHLFDLMGNPVRNWDLPAGVPGAQTGMNQVAWDGTDESGTKVTAGGYICQVLVAEDKGLVQGVHKIGVIH